MKMKLFGIIVIILIIGVYSVSEISVLDNDDLLTVATVNIADICFGSFEHWSELLLINHHDSHRIFSNIYQETRTSSSILYLSNTETNQHHRKYNSYTNTSMQWQNSRPTAVIITIHSSKQLEFILGTLKTDFQKIWRPESYFLIVLETKCNVTELNDMLKVVWNYWILNALILCSSNDAANRNLSEIELYTFNPYSVDHSPQWEIILHETVEVFIYTGKFNHSWHVFKQRFNIIRSFSNCCDLFFDKTSNLDGYVIPSSLSHPGFLLNARSKVPQHFEVDSHIMKTVAKRLRFDITQVPNDNPDRLGQVFENGSYPGMLDDIYHERSHILPAIRTINVLIGLEFTYPHCVFSVCFATRIVGFQPQWTNLTNAKHIWIGIGLCIIFFTLILYLQNKSYGIVSAFLDAERLIVGSSIIHSSTAIKYRIILGSIFLMFLVIDGSIRGRFISILTLARPYPNLDTVEELKEQDVKMYGHSFFKEEIVDPQLLARYNNEVSFSQCIEALERGEHQRACFTSCETLPFRIMNSSIIHGSSIPVWTRSVAFATAKHWPLKNRYSREMQKLVYAGIQRKWHLDISREFEVKAWKLKRAAIPAYVRSTKLNNLLPAFVLLFVGLLTASIAFAWEMRIGKSLRCPKL